MEKKKIIKCPRCQGILEVTNPKAEPVLLITCPNPQCGAKMRVTFDTGETQLAETERTDDQPGRLAFGGIYYPLAEGENSVGRQSKTSKATIQLPTDDLSMSRAHVRIMVHRLKSGRVKAIISDMRGADKQQQLPTRIDDEPMMPEDAFVLTHGDSITLGNTRIKYVK
ncbi:MAG: FHA domain-containing protein [Prevotella sp.]|nr:FHA domain-containing protein [Prevotella sp.]